MARKKISDLDEATILEFCEQEEELEDIAEAEGVELTDEDRERLEASIVESEEDEAAETIAASDDEDNLDDDPTIREDSSDEEDREERGLDEAQRFFLRAEKQEAYLREQEAVE